MSKGNERLVAGLIALSAGELAEVLAQAGLGKLVHAPQRLLVPFQEFEKHREFLERGGVAYDYGFPERTEIGHLVLPYGTRAWSAPMVQLPNGSMFIVATVGSASQRLIVPLENALG
ncbi:hypothetical protein [Myxococcus sp. RHSTA-1-4]|uniref:hypothetical protein n=1 Tax=Myxococcus sp. RHSTA-1-4 TaxID=2874601 RepID=UPI001CBB6B85|nr:hypothetical protein [Myxococcus sp. RHSTA-1-4]MBZ4422748.1 hypothetical protein [Myxococcus sp. RHSTA-1-4]